MPRNSPSDVAVEDGVIVVAARAECQEIFCCFGDLVTENLQLEISQIGVQCHCLQSGRSMFFQVDQGNPSSQALYLCSLLAQNVGEGQSP